jgi:hypothetical protein
MLIETEASFQLLGSLCDAFKVASSLALATIGLSELSRMVNLDCIILLDCFI